MCLLSNFTIIQRYSNLVRNSSKFIAIPFNFNINELNAIENILKAAAPVDKVVEVGKVEE